MGVYLVGRAEPNLSKIHSYNNHECIRIILNKLMNKVNVVEFCHTKVNALLNKSPAFIVSLVVAIQ